MKIIDTLSKVTLPLWLWSLVITTAVSIAKASGMQQLETQRMTSEREEE